MNEVKRLTAEQIADMKADGEWIAGVRAGKSYAQKMARYIRATAVVSAKAPAVNFIAFDECLDADFGKLEERILATLADKPGVLKTALHDNFIKSTVLPHYTGAPGGLGIVSDLPTTARMGCPWQAD